MNLTVQLAISLTALYVAIETISTYGFAWQTLILGALGAAYLAFTLWGAM